MGFLDFLKKLAKKEEREIKTEKIEFNNIDKWILTKEKEIEKDNQKVLDLIKDEIDKIVNNLDEKISVLENVDVDKIKFEDKVKFIVKENLEKYIKYVEKFEDDLEKLEKNNVIKLVNNINNLFSNFQKKSSLNFQKATILIGKELGAIRQSIGAFLTNIKKIINKNKDFFDKIRIFDSIKEKVAEKKKIEKLRVNINKNIEECNNKIESLEKEIKGIEKNIENIKKTKSYIEKNKKKDEIENIKEKFAKEIYKLREIINFKSLTNFYHSFEKEMNIIKDYKKNFRGAFENNNGKEIIQLLNESKLINDNLKNKINEILEIKQEIDNFVLEKDEIEELLEKIKKKKIEIENLNIVKTKEKKKDEKFNKNIIKITDFIKEDLNGFNVEIND